MRSQKTYIDKAPNKGGRGVFASQQIEPNEVIEEAAVMIIRDSALPDELIHHVYTWSKGKSALALGHASLYNHSYNPNAIYTRRPKRKSMLITAIDTIWPGDEIMINYNGDPESQENVGFEVCS